MILEINTIEDVYLDDLCAPISLLEVAEKDFSTILSFGRQKNGASLLKGAEKLEADTEIRDSWGKIEKVTRIFQL